MKKGNNGLFKQIMLGNWALMYKRMKHPCLIPSVRSSSKSMRDLNVRAKPIKLTEESRRTSS